MPCAPDDSQSENGPYQTVENLNPALNRKRYKQAGTQAPGFQVQQPFRLWYLEHGTPIIWVLGPVPQTLNPKPEPIDPKTRAAPAVLPMREQKVARSS